MERYGIQGLTAKLLTSYLQQKQQQVHWWGIVSNWMEIERGVPQGSVLGPLLFLTYINDLPQNITSQSMCLYADDTTFFNRSKNAEELRQTTDKLLEETKVWFNTNRLQLNRDKTSILTLYTKQNKIITNKTRFLGVTLSETLTWKERIDQLKTFWRALCFA